MLWTEFATYIRHLSRKDLERVREAFDLAERLHRGQTRKSGDPYITHPVTVALRLAYSGGDADTLIAALLHDAVEDTPITLAEIGRQFNGDVAGLIDGVTKLSAAEFDDKPNLNEQVETLRKIFSLMREDLRMMVIKLFDRLHNMETVEYLPEDRRRELAQETLDVYVKIADRLSMQDLRYELETLCLASLDPDGHGRLLALREHISENNRRAIETIRGTLLDRHADFAGKVKLHIENKSWETLQRQLETEGSVVTGLPGATVVFVCDNRDLCYRVMGALHGSWKREAMSFQDFINAPTLNGYRGLHTTIILENGMRVRCKLRTREMQDYARKGVTLYCFDPDKRKKLPELLPWTQQISSLTEDTRDRSSDFWQSLQSDILGDAITIYGPDDADARLPKNATVLDGAFFLFGPTALRLRSLKMDGKEVDFRTPLTHAATLDPTFAEEPTAVREWMTWARSSFATAKIRQFFTEQSEQARMQEGKELFQSLLLEKRRGFIEEFREESIVPALQSLGFRTLRQAYIAVAEGRLQSADLYTAIFESKKADRSDTHSTLIRYEVDMDNLSIMDAVGAVHRRFAEHLHVIRYQRGSLARESTVTLKATLTSLQKSMLLSELAAMGAQNVRLVRMYGWLRSFGAISTLMLLWGLDPVLGYLLINRYEVSPVDLTIIRFWTLSAISGFLLLWARIRSPLSEARLPLRSKSLWASVLLLFIVALTTYVSLENTLPSHYTIPMTAAGVVLTSIVHRGRWRYLLISWGALLIGTTLLIVYTPSWTITGILSTFGAVASFTAFSIISERYKRHERVGARAAQYFFVLSLACALLSLGLLPFSTIHLLPIPTLTWMVLFSVFLAGLPYYMYYYLLSHREIDFVLRYSFLIILSSCFGQLIVLGIVSRTIIAAGTIVLIGAALPVLPRQPIKHQPFDA